MPDFRQQVTSSIPAGGPVPHLCQNTARFPQYLENHQVEATPQNL
jgi:hypothetical protein